MTLQFTPTKESCKSEHQKCIRNLATTQLPDNHQNSCLRGIMQCYSTLGSSEKIREALQTPKPIKPGIKL